MSAFIPNNISNEMEDYLGDISNTSNTVENFEFKKVEDFFNNEDLINSYRTWSKLGRVLDYKVLTTKLTKNKTDKLNLLVLYFKTAEDKPCCLTIRFPTPNVFRLRFSPDAQNEKHFTAGNSRSIVTNSEVDLIEQFPSAEINVEELTVDNKEVIRVTVQDSVSKKVTMRLDIQRENYCLSVYKAKDDNSFIKAHGDAETAIYYKKRICYSVDQKEEI